MTAADRQLYSIVSHNQSVARSTGLTIFYACDYLSVYPILLKSRPRRYICPLWLEALSPTPAKKEQPHHTSMRDYSTAYRTQTGQHQVDPLKTLERDLPYKKIARDEMMYIGGSQSELATGSDWLRDI